MSYLLFRGCAIVLFGLLIGSQAVSIAKEQVPETPKLYKQQNGNYTSVLKPLNQLVTCETAVTEDDKLLGVFRSHLMQSLSSELHKFPILETSTYSAFVIIAKNGDFVGVTPVKGFENPDVTRSFNELVKLKSPYMSLPKEFLEEKGQFYVSSQGLQFHQHYPDKADRDRIFDQLTEAKGVQRWVKQVNKLIRANWHPPEQPYSRRATITVYIDEEGQILKKYLTTSSCNPNFDIAALNVPELIQKFPKPPSRMPFGFIKFGLVFDYEKR